MVNCLEETYPPLTLPLGVAEGGDGAHAGGHDAARRQNPNSNPNPNPNPMIITIKRGLGVKRPTWDCSLY